MAKLNINSFILTKTSAKYRITRDAYQFIVEKSRKNGEWAHVGYYHTLKGIFDKLLSLEMMANSDHTKLVDIIEQTALKLESAVESAINIIEKAPNNPIGKRSTLG